MPDSSPCLIIRKWAVTNAEWVAIVAPADCNTFSLREQSGKAFDISSDPSNPAAQDTVTAGNNFGFENAVALGLPAGLAIRFPKGSTILYVQAVDGTGASVVCYFGW